MSTCVFYLVYDQNFYGGRGGGWGRGKGVAVKDASSGVVGGIRNLSKNILKQGWVKAKVVRRGDEGFEGVTNTSSPPKKF